MEQDFTTIPMHVPRLFGLPFDGSQLCMPINIEYTDVHNYESAPKEIK